MSVFLERYILPILAALTLLVIVSNPLHFSWGQRIIGGSIVVLAAALVSRVAHRLNKKLQTSAETVDASPAGQESSSLPAKLTGGRVLMRVEPDYLMAFFKDHTAIQAKRLLAAFLDKWMRVSGKLDNVTPAGGDSISVVGQLTEADMHAITLYNCELEDN